MQPWATIYAIRNTRQTSSVNCPLHLSRILYKSALFMQNKPNFRKSQMNVSIFSKKAYENKRNWTLGENKPNSNPMSKLLVGAGPRWAESAKMAQRLANRGVITVQAESIRMPLKKPNLLKIKMLSCSHRPVPKTGTPFAHLNSVR